jgi:hypothetical protein
MSKICLLYITCFSFFWSTAFSQSAVCAYKYRKRITFDPTRVSGPIDLANFPALINIATDNDLRTVANSGHVENASGFDIVFTSADGVTLLNFQREKYTATNGQFTAWVRIPILSTTINTDIYMYYGNTAIVTDQSSTSVWSGYHGVWHLENGSFADSSPNGYNLTNNSTTNQSPAQINDGRANNGTQWLEVANTFPNITSNFSMSAWFFTTNNTQSGQRVFCDDVNNTGGYALSLGDGGTGALRFFSRSSNPVVLDSPNNTIANNTWYYVSAVADITNLTKRIFVNGVQVASGAYTNAWGTDAGNASAAGETASGETGNRLAGRIDEVRVASTALSADWLLTEYNNQSSPSTFYTISVEPKVWIGGTNINFNAASNWLGNNAPASGDDVIINNSTNQPTLQSDTQVNSIFIKTGATLSLSNVTLSVLRDISNCGTIAGNTGAINLNGAAAITQTQNISGTGTYNLTNLTINNTYSANPAVVLNKDVNVSGALVLTSGIMYTSATNILAMGTTATSGSGSSSSFVSGPMSKVGTANFIFPIGKGTRWRRASVTNLSASATFVAEYFNAAFTSTSPVNSPLNNVSSIEYWQIDRSAGTGNANVSLYWEAANQSGITNCADLTIARWNGASWDERPGTTTGASSCSGAGTGTVVSNAVITAFSPFTFGSKLSTVNPLPINLTDFTAVCHSGKILIKWSTATETNNDHFVLERSLDAESWTEAANIKGAGTSSSPHNYSFDDTFLSNEISYYRLSQVDRDGKTERFKIISANCVSSVDKMTVFPNPASNEINFQFDLSKNYGLAEIRLLDNMGKICFKQKVELSKGQISYKFSSLPSAGAYTVLFYSEQLTFPAQKLIIN